MPAVKTSTSMPPDATAMPATAPATRWTKTSTASAAGPSPSCARCSNSSMRPSPPARPRMPDSSFSARSRASASMPDRRSTADDRTRIDRARARRHRHAFDRAESHRGVERTAVHHGRHGAPAAEMAHHQPQALRRAADDLGRPLRSPGHREAVEAVPAHPPLLAPPAGDGIGRGRGRDRDVEGGVEHRHVRQAGETPPGDVERPQRRGVVERRQRPQLRDLGLDAVVDEHGRAKPLAAVDDAMGDGVDGRRIDVVERSTRSDVSPSPTRCSLRLVEPAFTTRTSPTPRSVRPRPVADVGRVIAVLARVGTVADAGVDHLLAQVAPLGCRGPARGRSRP